MFYFDGEWYWGVDRLHHLEARLRDEGLAKDAAAPLIAPFRKEMLDGSRPGKPLLIEH
jgi:hypothetical protein